MPYPDTPARAAYVSWRSTIGNAPAAAAAAAAAATPADAPDGPALAAAVLAARAEAVPKYSCALSLTLSARPRPPPAVVVTDAAAGVRPVLPAGYGSGFEIGGYGWQAFRRGSRTGTDDELAPPLLLLLHILQMHVRFQHGTHANQLHGATHCAGRLPLSLMRMPRHSTADAAAIAAAGSLGATAPFCPSPVALAVESALHRPYTTPCELPNSLSGKARGTAGGCCGVAFSRDGRWLAAACTNSEGATKASRLASFARHHLSMAHGRHISKVWHVQCADAGWMRGPRC